MTPRALLPFTALALTASLGAVSAEAATNGRIAYVEDTSYERIVAVNADGSGKTTLIDAGRDTVEPAWTPDGQRLTFTRRLTGGTLMRLFVAAADGSGAKQLTDGGTGDPASAAGDYDSAWSPDGTRVAFTRWDGDWNIYVANADGSGAHRVSGAGSNRDATWSADGTKLAYSSLRGGGEQIYVVGADGTGEHPLTATGANRAPAWSPDGARIAFVSERGGTRDIYIMNADGGNQQPLMSGAEVDGAPAWAPDGTAIAFTRGDSGAEDVWVMGADGAAPHALAATAARETDPAWQPLGGGAPPAAPPVAPPVAPSPAPAPAPPVAAKPKPVAVSVLPTIKKCVAGATLTIRVDGTKAKLKSFTLTVDGKKLKVKAGKRRHWSATVKLPKKGKATVVATGKLTDGRAYKQTRAYSRCGR